MAGDRTFNWRVLDQIEALIDEHGISRAEVITRSGMRRNTFFAKMRGDTALTTDDISKLSEALGVEPELVLRRAANSNVTPLRNASITEDEAIALGAVAKEEVIDVDGDENI